MAAVPSGLGCVRVSFVLPSCSTWGSSSHDGRTLSCNKRKALIDLVEGCFTLSQNGNCLCRPRSRTRSNVGPGVSGDYLVSEGVLQKDLAREKPRGL